MIEPDRTKMSDPEVQESNAKVAWANSFGCLGIIVVILAFFVLMTAVPAWFALQEKQIEADSNRCDGTHLIWEGVDKGENALCVEDS